MKFYHIGGLLGILTLRVGLSSNLENFYLLCLQMLSLLILLCPSAFGALRWEDRGPSSPRRPWVDTAGFIAPIAHQARWRDRKCPPGPPGRRHLPSRTYPAAFGPRVSYRSRQPLKHKRQKGKGIWRRPSCCPQPRPRPVSFGFSCPSV